MKKLILATLFIIGCTSPAVKQATMKEMLDIPQGTESRTIQLSKILVKIQRGTKVGVIQSGLLCVHDILHGDLQWHKGTMTLTDEDFTTVVHDELDKANSKW